MNKDFFPPLNPPRIYAYSDSRFDDCFKVGYTSKTVSERVAEQYPVKLPNQSYKIELDEIAMREDGSFFTDHDLHKVLTRKNIQRINGEWFKCTLDIVKAALLEVKTGKMMCAELAGDFHLGDSRQLTDKSLLPFDLVS